MNTNVAREIKDAWCAWFSGKTINTNIDELETPASKVLFPRTYFWVLCVFLLVGLLYTPEDTT